MPRKRKLTPAEFDQEVLRFQLRRQGQRNHVKARFRTVKPLLRVPLNSGALIDRFLSLVCPWRVQNFPGPHRVVGELCAVSGSYAIKRWRKPNGLPPNQAEWLARFLESRVAREVTLIEELRAYAARRRAEMPAPYLARMTMTERQLIAARRRAQRQVAARGLQKSSPGRFSSDGT
jgi:hypothetical protein